MANFVRDDQEPPASPIGQRFSDSANILVVFEFNTPMDDSSLVEFLAKIFLNVNPRFTSIMVKDEKGIVRWRKVMVNLKDHVCLPNFPPNIEHYDEYVQDYLAQIAMSQLPKTRPRWEFHIIKYPTKRAYGTLVIKLHHSLGDGFTLMSILYSYFKSADDPSRPLTFPTSKTREVRQGPSCRGAIRNLSSGLYTITDFCWTVWKSTFGADAVTPIRSGNSEVMNRLIDISLLEFAMNDIKKIKEKIQGTVNDVISGVIFYGVNLYMHACGHNTKGANVTAQVIVNNRTVRAYQTVQEMTKPNSKAPWGNNFALLPVAVPMCKDSENVDPLYFVAKTSKTIKAKKNSHGLFLTGLLLKTMAKIRGPEAMDKYLRKTLKNTSLGISNLVGPTEQMMIANHPIDKFYFVIAGGPHSLCFGVVSYMGRLNVVMTTERGFINPTLMANCIEKSFQRILEAAT